MKKIIPKIFGQELILDLYDCDPEILSSKKKILEYSDKICKVIGVKKYKKAKEFTKKFFKAKKIKSKVLIR